VHDWFLLRGRLSLRGVEALSNRRARAWSPPPVGKGSGGCALRGDSRSVARKLAQLCPSAQPGDQLAHLLGGVRARARVAPRRRDRCSATAWRSREPHSFKTGAARAGGEESMSNPNQYREKIEPQPESPIVPEAPATWIGPKQDDPGHPHPH